MQKMVMNDENIFSYLFNSSVKTAFVVHFPLLF